MNYDRLKANYTLLVDRYFPDLSNKDNAFSALQVIDSDPQIVEAEKDALRRYVGTHTTPSIYNYHWCVECECMIGYEGHRHCPLCTYPCMVEPAVNLGTAPATFIAECGNCGACCENANHKHCEQCRRHIGVGMLGSCRHCNKCTQCCVCVLCPRGCSELQECTDCHSCFDHCTCPAAASNGPYGKTWPAFKRSERTLFDCKRLSGTEWEYNRVRSTRIINHWARKWLSDIHQDASCGYEAVTAPVAGDYMVKCITALGQVFKKSGAQIDERCSLHTHVDAKDLQWTEMFNLLDVYSRIEPVLFLIGGQERLDNRYCIPCGKDYGTALKCIDRKNAVMAVAFTPITREGRKSEPNFSPYVARNAQRALPGKRADNHINCRRKSLNICPWLAGRVRRVNGKRVMAPDTTVEFRMHANTSDPNEVINWVKIVTRLVDWSATASSKDMQSLPKSPLRIICDVIAPECKAWILQKLKEWRLKNSKHRTRGGRRRITFINGKYEY